MDSGHLQVEVQFALLNILDVSTAKEYIEVHGWWRMYWNDPVSIHGGREILSRRALIHFLSPTLFLFEKVSDNVINTVSVLRHCNKHSFFPRRYV